MALRQRQGGIQVHPRDLDAVEIAPGLWQGSAPVTGPSVRKAGFDALVLAAQEYQPPEEQFPGVAVLRLRIEDAPIKWDDWVRAIDVATKVSQVRARGGRVLSTCQAGLNRSGLVSALSLIILDGMNPATAIARVRGRRAGALFNESFVQVLRRSR